MIFHLANLSMYLWHPLVGRGYQFWSGIGSDFGELTLIATIIGIWGTFLHHHNCHVQGCWRLKWHPHPQHGHPVCKKHFGDDAPTLQDH